MPDTALAVQPPRAKSSQPEFRLQVALADRIRRLKMPDVFWTAIPNGEDRPKAQDRHGNWYSPTGQRLERAGLRPGNPDLFFIVRGRPIGLELKAGNGAQSEDQEAVQTDWTLSGGLYHLARTYDEAVAFLEMVGVLKPDRSLTRHQPAEVRT